jgi:hypothetical protein
MAIAFVVVGVLVAGIGEAFGLAAVIGVAHASSQHPSQVTNDLALGVAIFLVIAALCGALGNTVVWIAAQRFGHRPRQ